ncbi:hypothetical protein AAY473_030673 [Plecturocebus cupreus]
MPIMPTLWEAKAGGPLEPRSWRPAWATVFECQHIFHTYGISRLGIATLPGLKGHIWLVATIVDSAGLRAFQDPGLKSFCMISGDQVVVTQGARALQADKQGFTAQLGHFPPAKASYSIAVNVCFLNSTVVHAYNPSTLGAKAGGSQGQEFETSLANIVKPPTLIKIHKISLAWSGLADKEGNNIDEDQREVIWRQLISGRPASPGPDAEQPSMSLLPRPESGGDASERLQRLAELRPSAWNAPLPWAGRNDNGTSARWPPLSHLMECH